MVWESDSLSWMKNGEVRLYAFSVMLVFTMLFHGEDITKTRIILKHPRMYLNLSISLFVSEGEITSLCLVCSSFIGISSFLLKYYKNSSTTVASKDAFKQEYRFVSIWRKNNESFLPCLSFFLWDFLVSAEVLQKLEQAVASKNVFKQEYRLVSVWRSNELPSLFFSFSGISSCLLRYCKNSNKL